VTTADQHRRSASDQHRRSASAPEPLPPTQIGPRLFEWGSRTYVMGIVNVTPDSFSGDGLLATAAGPTTSAGATGARASVARAADALAAAVAQARRMVDEGADILDVGGESTRPGHEPVAEDEEAGRVVPVIASIHAALPDVPISIDSSKPAVAAAAIDAGASLINDVWGVSPDDAMCRLAAARQVPIILMHNRATPEYRDFVAEFMADMRAALARAIAAGVPRQNVILDPGFGFGKTPAHNLIVMRELARLRGLGQPVLLGTSRKSTIGRVLGGLPPEERLEGTLATTAIGIAAGVDIVRVHDVLANVRAALVADGISRGDNL
jgi:dihydropteroate synthase